VAVADASTSTVPYLVARDLTVSLRARVIGPIDLVVPPESIVALRGPNGSGKTTTIRASLGLIRSTTGVATIHGSKVDPLHPPHGVGYLPDQVEFWEWLDGSANVLPFARDPRELSSILDAVGLGDVGDLPVRRYSRGMRQRLGIARALAGSPSLIVMDEPTIALDTQALDALEHLLHDRLAIGCSVLVASHDSAFVERIATTIVELQDGLVRS
jgi:ABC-type multidrug transport system ATPase subunit